MRYMITILICLALAANLAYCEQFEYWQKLELLPGEMGPHILGVKAKGDSILVGTFNKGAFFSTDSGVTWRHFVSSPTDESTGLSFDYIIGGDWDGSEFVLATLGDGINISKNGGQTWKRFGYDYFGIEYLYTVGAISCDSMWIIPTADGIVGFIKKLDDHTIIDFKQYGVITEKAGLASQYIYDLVTHGDTMLAGTLHGFSRSTNFGRSWRKYSPDGITNNDWLPLSKVRAVAVDRIFWYAGLDSGLYVTDDKGNNWYDISKGLPSKFIHDILIDRKKTIWIATYKGVATSDDRGKTYKVYGKESGFYGENINCLAELEDGSIIAGTNYGLYRQTNKKPVPNMYPQPRVYFNKPEQPIHQWLIRPVSTDNNNQKDQTYLYGCTMGGNFRQHQGCEFNNPEGVPLLAVDSGTIVFIDTAIGHTVLKCDSRYEDYYVYAHYHHQSDIIKETGDKVKRGETIGYVGKKGNVTNEHLHFELSISKTDDTNIRDKTVNNELWMVPLSGCGTIVGNVVDRNNNHIRKIKIYGVEKPVPTETPFSYAESYGDSVNPSPAYAENFVIADVPSGDHVIWVERNSAEYAVNIKVESGKVTRVKIIAGK